jgi:16S rRNA (cytosine967-C5)-methyltransferase
MPQILKPGGMVNFLTALLLDAPCSALGVIRRHPDIKLLRRAEDIKPLQALQRNILRAVWPLLAPGGIMLYATCSILK